LNNLRLILGIVFEIVAVAIIVTSILLDNDILGARTDSIVLLLAILGIFFIAAARAKNQK